METIWAGLGWCEAGRGEVGWDALGLAARLLAVKNQDPTSREAVGRGTSEPIHGPSYTHMVALVRSPGGTPVMHTTGRTDDCIFLSADFFLGLSGEHRVGQKPARKGVHSQRLIQK